MGGTANRHVTAIHHFRQGSYRFRNSARKAVRKKNVKAFLCSGSVRLISQCEIRIRQRRGGTEEPPLLSCVEELLVLTGSRDLYIPDTAVLTLDRANGVLTLPSDLACDDADLADLKSADLRSHVRGYTDADVLYHDLDITDVDHIHERNIHQSARHHLCLCRGHSAECQAYAECESCEYFAHGCFSLQRVSV
jgi:hypothetical protein